MGSDAAPPLTATGTPGATGLRAQAVGGARWGGVVGLLEQVLSVAVTVVLTRLLTPGDFGLVAIATVVAQLLGLVTQIGVAASLVKRPEVDDLVSSTAFWALTGLSTTVAVAAAVNAGALADLAGEAAAAPLLAVLMGTLVLRAAASVPRSLLQRQLAFRKVYLADLLAFAVYAAVQLLLAFLGAGVWSIVIGQVASAATLCVTLLVLARWWPRLRFSWRVVREERRFAAGLLATMVLTYAVKNVDYLLVSWLGSAELLGVYYIVYVLPNILRQRLTWLTSELLLPMFSRIREDVARSRAAYAQSVALHSMVGVPAMVGIAVTAEPLLATFFGPQWAGGAGALRILALAVAVDFTTQAAATVFIAHSRTGVLSAVPGLRLVTFALLCAALLPLVGFSLTLIAAAVLGAALVAGTYAQWRVAALLGLRLRSLLPAQAAITTSAVVMSGAVVACDDLAGPPVVQLAVQVVVGAVTMLLCVRFLFWRVLRGPAREALSVVLPSRPARRGPDSSS